MRVIHFGTRPQECLEYIPPRLRARHEFCFYLHDRMVALLKEYEAAGVHTLISRGVAKAAAAGGVKGELDVLELLKKAGLTEASKHLLLGHLVLGLTSDLLHFLYEGLCCLERRKFAVALSLLRKPFKENMLFLAWLLGDPDDFLSRFQKDNYTSLNGLQPLRRQELLRLAADKLATKEAFDGELIERMIFSKEAGGLEPLWQKATHLITSQGTNLKTEDLNINFIFNDASSDHLYDAVYEKLPYLMLFLMQLALRSFSELAHTNVATTSHLVLTSLAAYECLIGPGSRPVASHLIKSLRPLLTCLHCRKPLRFDRMNTISLLLKEQVTCSSCGLESEVPLYWLLARSEVNVVPDDQQTVFKRLMSEAKHSVIESGSRPKD